MFLNFLPSNPEECETIGQVIEDVDNKIAFLSNALYRQKAFLEKNNVKLRELKDLLYYKSFLKKMIHNSEWLSEEDIISKIKHKL